MVKSRLLDPREIKLDMSNPRFSLFKFQNEKQVIDYLAEYEGIKSLAHQIIRDGYVTLGERVIVLESGTNKNKSYTVLEGNRRIAALKIIFNEVNRFNSSDRKRIDKLDIKDFFVDCDIVEESEKDEALYKITAKHIDGIKEWRATDKRVFYDNLFSQYIASGMTSDEALSEIEKITPETKAKVKNALRRYRFLSSVHNQVKKINPELEELSHLENDVLVSRVQPRLKSTLCLSEDDNFNMTFKENKEYEFSSILRLIGQAAWVNETLNTRTFDTQNMWNKILDDNIVVPGLKAMIQAYLSTEDDKKESGQVDIDSSKKQTSNKGTSSKEESDTESHQSEGHTNPKDDANNEDDSHKKYKMFVINSTVEITNFDYQLTDNINIVDEKGDYISRSSSVFENVSFGSENSNIAINKNKILSVSQNGKYIVKARFFDIERTFSVFLKIPQKRSSQEVSKDLFSEKWYEDSVALLSSKEEYSNIVSVLICLNENRIISKTSDRFVLISFLIRILIEYSSKAYWDKYRKEKKKPSSLSGYISNISTYLFQKNIITLEEKKGFANGNDLETLNSQIHDYKSNISSIAIETIFKAYQGYLDNVFSELNK